jgi:hypothetical protein
MKKDDKPSYSGRAHGAFIPYIQEPLTPEYQFRPLYFLGKEKDEESKIHVTHKAP